MAIEVSLEVTDRGSAVVHRAADNMTRSLRGAEIAASRLGTQFSRVGSRILTMIGSLFSFNSLVGVLAGGAGIGLLTRKMMELGAAAGNERFNAGMTTLKSSWTEFTEKLGRFIAESPGVQQGLADLAQRVVDWGNALIANKDVIESWAAYAAKAVTGVASLINSAVEGMANLVRNAPIANMSEQQVQDQLSAALGGQGFFGTGGTTVDSSTASTAKWAAYVAEQQSGRAVITNNYFSEKMSRSDIQAIINEMDRAAYRDVSPPPDLGDY